jgi:hypothetical protein
VACIDVRNPATSSEREYAYCRKGLVKVNNIVGEFFLQRAKCLSAIRHNGFEEKWKELLLKTISMLFHSIDLFHIRFMIR